MNAEPLVLTSSTPSDPNLPLPLLLSSEAEKEKEGFVSEDTIEDHPEFEAWAPDEPPWGVSSSRFFLYSQALSWLFLYGFNKLLK